MYDLALILIKLYVMIYKLEIYFYYLLKLKIVLIKFLVLILIAQTYLVKYFILSASLSLWIHLLLELPLVDIRTSVNEPCFFFWRSRLWQTRWRTGRKVCFFSNFAALPKNNPLEVASVLASFILYRLIDATGPNKNTSECNKMVIND